MLGAPVRNTLGYKKDCSIKNKLLKLIYDQVKAKKKH
jgi:hypothetical protein